MDSSLALIIDDEADICFLLGKILSEKKYTIAISNNLHDGFIQLSETKPSLLFLDIKLPDGSGLDALNSIRKKNPFLKIVVMSAYDGMKERKQAMESGANFFISKPLNTTLINEALQSIQSTTEP